jgi:hypothetical protein
LACNTQPDITIFKVITCGGLDTRPLSVTADMSTSSGVSSSRSSVSSYPFFSPQISRDVEPHDFANVEDMLFEVFRCEETDSIDSISIAQFLKVYNLHDQIYL